MKSTTQGGKGAIEKYLYFSINFLHKRNTLLARQENGVRCEIEMKTDFNELLPPNADNKKVF